MLSCVPGAHYLCSDSLLFVLSVRTPRRTIPAGLSLHSTTSWHSVTHPEGYNYTIMCVFIYFNKFLDNQDYVIRLGIHTNQNIIPNAVNI